MQIHLCRKSLGLASPQSDGVVGALRDRDHTPVVRDCLSRCQSCERGLAIATVDGIPLQAPGYEGLLADIEALAATEG